MLSPIPSSARFVEKHPIIDWDLSKSRPWRGVGEDRRKNPPICLGARDRSTPVARDLGEIAGRQRLSDRLRPLYPRTDQTWPFFDVGSIMMSTAAGRRRGDGETAYAPRYDPEQSTLSSPTDALEPRCRCWPFCCGFRRDHSTPGAVCLGEICPALIIYVALIWGLVVTSSDTSPSHVVATASSNAHT